MRYRLLSLSLVGLLLVLSSCGSDQEPTRGVSALAPDPLNNDFSVGLYPNTDLSPQEWLPQPGATYNYQNIDESDLADGANIYTTHNGDESRFGFTNVNSVAIDATKAEVRLHVDYDLHPEEIAYITVWLYAGGVLQGSHEFTYCTPDAPGGASCDQVGPRDGEAGWSHEFTGLNLNNSKINSLEVKVSADVWFIHGQELTHAVHIDQLNVVLTCHEVNRGEPDPEQQ